MQRSITERKPAALQQRVCLDAAGGEMQMEGVCFYLHNLGHTHSAVRAERRMVGIRFYLHSHGHTHIAVRAEMR